ncbi:MAG: hypothetical protein A2017_15945 [Lentisphaerae bacterium GWF2_44_16]|nr:MAG: hypothetical protein A2017_15945 [Lentisphaerae bacterium GWF2_44_16]
MNCIYNLDIGQTGKIPLTDIVASHIRNLVFSGGLKDGDEIPTVRDLAKRWPVSHVVIQRALAKCSDEGLLLRSPGRKCIVRTKENKSSGFSSVCFVVEQTPDEAKKNDMSASSYFMGFLNGLQSAMEKSGIAVNAFTVTGNSQQKNFIDRIKKNPVDLIVLMRSKSQAFIDEINSTGSTLVLVEPHVFNEKGFVVHHDEKRAAEDMISAFVKHGCERLALLYFDDGKWVTAERIRCLGDALKSSRLTSNPNWCKKLPSRETGTISFAIKNIFKGLLKPDGLIIMNVTSSILETAFSQIGNPLPDLKLGIYTDDERIGNASFVVIVSSYDFGKAAGDFLYNSFYRRQIKGKVRKLVVPYKFKNSTAK